MGQAEGSIAWVKYGVNDVTVYDGLPVAVVVRSAVRTVACSNCCGHVTEAWPADQFSETCEACRGLCTPQELGSCQYCGSREGLRVALYSGCVSCCLGRPGRRRRGRKAKRSEKIASYTRSTRSVAASCSHVGAVNTVKNPVYHIVEGKGSIDRMNAVDIPPGGVLRCSRRRHGVKASQGRQIRDGSRYES